MLIVDDEPVIQRLIERILQRSGAEVAVAGNLAQARAHLASSPDVVLLDRTLGHERGRDLLTDLRSAAPAPCVLYFSGDTVGTAERALVDGVVPKPVPVRVLVATVADALRKRERASA